MSVEIILCWDGTARDELRNLALLRVLGHLAPLGWPIRLATDEHVPYRLGWAVNQAAKTSRAQGADVFVVHYADVIVPHEQIRAAVDLVYEGWDACFAFDEYWEVGGPYEDFQIEDAPANACLALYAEMFREIGGYDEKFAGWGMEDREFNDRCKRMNAKVMRLEGRLEHLWHGPRREDGSTFDTSEEQVAANRAYYARLRDG